MVILGWHVKCVSYYGFQSKHFLKHWSRRSSFPATVFTVSRLVIKYLQSIHFFFYPFSLFTCRYIHTLKSVLGIFLSLFVSRTIVLEKSRSDMIAKMGTEGGTERQKQVLGFVFLENQEGRVCFCLCRCGWRMIHRGQKMCLSRAFLLLCLPGKWDFELGPCWFCQAGGENWQREIQTKGMEVWGNLPGRFQVLFYLLCFPHISSLVNREGKELSLG